MLTSWSDRSSLCEQNYDFIWTHYNCSNILVSCWLLWKIYMIKCDMQILGKRTTFASICLLNWYEENKQSQNPMGKSEFRIVNGLWAKVNSFSCHEPFFLMLCIRRYVKEEKKEIQDEEMQQINEEKKIPNDRALAKMNVPSIFRCLRQQKWINITLLKLNMMVSKLFYHMQNADSK